MEIYAESSGIDTSPDMNSSVEVSSPDRISVQPRKLTFDLSPENRVPRRYLNSNLTVSPHKQPSISPPYRRVKALRLFDSPATPKTIIQKSSSNGSKYMKYLSTNQKESDILAKPIDDSLPVIHEKPRCVPLNKSHDWFQSANVNPFTPKCLLMRTGEKKRSRMELEDSHLNNSFLNKSNTKRNIGNKTLPTMQTNLDIYNHFSEVESCDRQAPKRLALQDSNISRYAKEFIELSRIGTGEFGVVYQCLNRLDGCVYAVKKSIKPVAGSVFEKTALNEVYAHAVLEKHENVVRYYSAWAENNHMFIQNEYCNGGSLQSLLQERYLNEPQLKTLLMHIAEGLKYIHSKNLVHMDVKAGNIFISKTPRTTLVDGYDDGFEDTFDELDNEIITYKIGDLGHVTSVQEPQVEEGDCHYLPNEILQEDYRHLAKADIYSLGITLYEAAGGGPLPKNGPEWHRLRNGNVPDLPGISREFNDLIKLMMHPDPDKRPSSTSIFNYSTLCPLDNKTKAQLSLELSIEREEKEAMFRKIKELKKIIKSYEGGKTPVGKRARKSPGVSDRKLRSYSRKKRVTSSIRTRRNFASANKTIIDELDY